MGSRILALEVKQPGIRKAKSSRARVPRLHVHTCLPFGPAGKCGGAVHCIPDQGVFTVVVRPHQSGKDLAPCDTDAGRKTGIAGGLMHHHCRRKRAFGIVFERPRLQPPGRQQDQTLFIRRKFQAQPTILVNRLPDPIGQALQPGQIRRAGKSEPFEPGKQDRG